MSHTTALKGMQIRSIEAMTNAIAQLNTKGIKCSLVPNTTPRAFYPNQEGLGLADYVVVLADAKYDIGLYKQEDGTYEPRTDFWNRSVENVLGGTATSESFKDTAKIGKLLQEYGVQMTMLQARLSGKTFRRIDDAATGKTQLVLTGY